jgi:CheY-specific phosphatase CheX
MRRIYFFTVGKIAVTQHKNVLIIKVPEDLTKTFSDDMLIESNDWIKSNVESYLFDFSDVKKINSNIYRPFVTFSQQIKKLNRSLTSVHMLQSIYDRLERDGVLPSFNAMAVIPDVDEKAVSKQAKGPLSADEATLVGQLIQAALTTMQSFANLKGTPGKAKFLQSRDSGSDANISIISTVNIAGGKFNGSISLCFDQKSFLNIFQQISGTAQKSIGGSNQDAAAEILNIVYNTARTQLNKSPGFTLPSIIPEVLTGEKIKTYHKMNEKVIVLPFTWDSGAFLMEIAVKG